MCAQACPCVLFEVEVLRDFPSWSHSPGAWGQGSSTDHHSPWDFAMKTNQMAIGNRCLRCSLLSARRWTWPCLPMLTAQVCSQALLEAAHKKGHRHTPEESMEQLATLQWFAASNTHRASIHISVYITPQVSELKCDICMASLSSGWLHHSFTRQHTLIVAKDAFQLVNSGPAMM